MLQYKNYGPAPNERVTKQHDGLMLAGDKANLDNIMVGNFAAKVTPVDADTMPLNDSASDFSLKKVTWANIKATLKAYFDTFYTTLTSFAALGTGLAVQRSTNLAVAAATITPLLTLSIPAGKWLVTGQAIFQMGAGAGTADAQIAGTTWAFAKVLAANEITQFDVRPLVVTGPATATMNGYSSAACTCLWVAGGSGGSVTSLYAVQVG